MNITHKHAHHIQRTVDFYAELCELLPHEELTDFKPEYLPHIQRVARKLRGDHPVLVADAVLEARDALGLPMTYMRNVGDGVRRITILELVEDVLEAALSLVLAEFEVLEDGEWVRKKEKVSHLNEDALEAVAIAGPAQEFFVEYLRDYGNGLYFVD